MKHPAHFRELIDGGPRGERRAFHFESQVRAHARKTPGWKKSISSVDALRNQEQGHHDKR